MKSVRIRPLARPAVLAAMLAASAYTAPAAEENACMESRIVGELLSVEAQRIGTAVERLDDASEVERYIEVINEEPPVAGPAEELLILVHPEFQVARVFLVHDGNVCERYLIGPELHRKAWLAARGLRV
jgi:hypothetical protein